MAHRKANVISLIASLVVGLVLFYLILPPLNVSSGAFWVFIGILVAVFAAVNTMLLTKGLKPQVSGIAKYVVLVYCACLVLIMGLNLFMSPIFTARSYASRITVNETTDFYSDVQEVNFDHLPLLDKASSQKLGDRVMGQMPELVSQFYVSDLYTQINLNDQIVRVTPLEYDGVVKYFTNRKEGVKGYITVNSVDGEANLVKLEEGMRYMPSAYFFENLYRHVRFAYPFEILGDPTFELDNSGKPYWVFPCISYSGVNLKTEIEAVILVDPVEGDMEKYNVGEVPTWIDHVYPASLIIEQVDQWGELRGGYLNSIFGQKNVVNTTDGYNYTVMNDDVYLYTGITSKASDESNLGFILSNLRTKETHFYSVPGAEEYSAMASAQGQVQQMGYEASFPLLINLNNKATYLISLKDNAGLVKMYAFVDVADYQKVVVSDASLGIEAAAKKYIGDVDIVIDESEIDVIEIMIAKITDANIEGNTYYYFEDMDRIRYRASIAVAPLELPFLESGDVVELSYYLNEGIREVIEIN
ncbi:MAG: hypothetical protein IKL88_06635 [Erysipelotrichales bacterium]|nr:hypothetical protein [Erysipelotrichales bacterium]